MKDFKVKCPCGKVHNLVEEQTLNMQNVVFKSYFCEKSGLLINFSIDALDEEEIEWMKEGSKSFKMVVVPKFGNFRGFHHDLFKLDSSRFSIIKA